MMNCSCSIGVRRRKATMATEAVWPSSGTYCPIRQLFAYSSDPPPALFCQTTVAKKMSPLFDVPSMESFDVLSWNMEIYWKCFWVCVPSIFVIIFHYRSSFYSFSMDFLPCTNIRSVATDGMMLSTFFLRNLTYAFWQRVLAERFDHFCVLGHNEKSCWQVANSWRIKSTWWWWIIEYLTFQLTMSMVGEIGQDLNGDR